MLPKKHRLTKDKDFQKVFKRGKYYSRAWLGIKINKNNLKINRFGFLIGLKISKKATVRNKIRRRLSEVIRLKLEQIKPGFDVIVLVQPEIVDKTYQEIDKNLTNLLKKAKIWIY